MKPYQNVLVYIDDRAESIVALETALTIARRHEARLSLVDVADGFDEELELWPSDGDRLEMKRHVTATRRSWLATRVAEYHLPEEVQVKVAWGDPAVELIRTAIRHNHDLIIKTARGGGGSMFGTTAQHLIRKAPCPVWLTTASRLPLKPRVVAAVNPGLSDLGPTYMSRSVLGHAQAVAGSIDAELHVACAIEQLGPRWLKWTEQQDEVEQLVARVRRRKQSNLLTLCSEVTPDLVSNRIHAAEGDPASQIPDLVGRLGADIVVMGTIGHHLADGLLIGGVVETLLQRLDCSVYCVKPDEFASPIKVRENEFA